MSHPNNNATTITQHPTRMEPKYRTLVQAAIIVLVLAFVILGHDNEKGEQAIAQKTSQSRG